MSPLSGLTARSVSLVAVQIAEGYASAGVRESGGNNLGGQVEFFQRLFGGSPGESWCAYFVSACLVKGLARSCGWIEDREHLPGYVRRAGALLVPLGGYCPALVAAASIRGRWRQRDFRPSRGDLVLFDFDGRSEPHHVGFVRADAGAGNLLTVEGNTSSGRAGSQANGDGVYCRSRDRAHVFGFVSFA